MKMKTSMIPTIRYHLVNRVNPQEPEAGVKLGPVMVYKKEITFERVCEMISERSLLCDADVEQVLQALLTNATMLLMDSEAFDLGKLGYLTTVMKTDLVDDPDAYKASNIRSARVVFHPSAWFRREMKKVNYQRVASPKPKVKEPAAE